MPLVGSKTPLFTKAAIMDGQISEVSLEKNLRGQVDCAVGTFYPHLSSLFSPPCEAQANSDLIVLASDLIVLASGIHVRMPLGDRLVRC